jgi:hypothetical protein
MPQVPATQVPVAFGTVAHRRPHAPQLLGSVESDRHVLPQTLEPPVHVEQVPAVQIWPGRHGLPHAPQLSRSVLAYVSQPSDATPLQSRYPE